MKKKLFLLTLFLFIALGGSAQVSTYGSQQDHRDLAKNELNLNVFNVLVFGVLEAGYERIISEQASVSVDVFADAFNKSEGEDVNFSDVYTKDFSVTTGIKYFFSENKIARGLYAEGFGMISSGDTDETDAQGNEVQVNYTDFALGIGVGGKFVARQGLMIDFSFGLGRNLFHNDSPVLVLLPAINFGYRF